MGPRFAGYFTITQLGDKTLMTNRPTFNIDNQLRRIQGFAGCNTYNAAFTEGGGKLEIVAPLATKKACADGMDIEQKFTEALPKVNAFTIEKNILILFDKERNVLLKAKPTDI
ncbi:META domain-containing protein [Dokdonia sp. Hel_I_53]|nr:META domain-containing protein [Dokdonia sp. Hel_I_53]